MEKLTEYVLYDNGAETTYHQNWSNRQQLFSDYPSLIKTLNMELDEVVSIFEKKYWQIKWKRLSLFDSLCTLAHGS
jgi:hypothetical protein